MRRKQPEAQRKDWAKHLGSASDADLMDLARWITEQFEDDEEDDGQDDSDYDFSDLLTQTGGSDNERMDRMEAMVKQLMDRNSGSNPKSQRRQDPSKASPQELAKEPKHIDALNQMLGKKFGGKKIGEA